MTTSRSCSWCHTMNVLVAGQPVSCVACEHRADLPRMDCDCPKCRRFETPRDVDNKRLIVGDAVKFLEPYQGFAGGKVAAIIRGISGPIAAVEIAPGRKVDVLCRQLRREL
jgi:hypothetical protein